VTFKSNDGRRFDHPISGIWPNAAQAIGAAIGPVKLPILLDAIARAAEHFPAVGLDADGESAFGPSMEPNSTSFAHGLDPAIDSAKPLPNSLFTATCRKDYRINPSGVTIVIAQGVPDQAVQLIV
jgi:hypothetical protein